MLRHRYCAFEPGRVPEVEQHLRSGGQAVHGEVERLGRTFAVESADLFQSINIFHQRVRLAQISDVVDERIIEPLGSLHETGKIFFPEIRGDVDAFKLPMDVVLGGISVGIGADPSVVLDGGVQRL